MITVLKTFEELCSEEIICKYCPYTNYGEHENISYIDSKGFHACEGMYCEESYEKYLSDNKTNEKIIKYAVKVKLKNMEELE